MGVKPMNNSIIVNLMGGLGNQLFQYAFARTLADKRGINLILDHRMVKRKAFLSGLAIELFNIRAKYIDEDTAKKYPEWQWKLSRSVKRHWRPWLGFYHETTLAYEQGALSQANDVALSGFWQSYKYIDLTSQLLNDLTLLTPYNENQQSFIDHLASVNSFTVHVRRGDYLANPKALAKHGICSKIYYQFAVDLINKGLDNPVFFIFSDDPQWVKANLKL